MAPIFGELLPRITDNKWKIEISKQTNKVLLLNKIKEKPNDYSSHVYTEMYLNLRKAFIKTRKDSKLNYQDFNNNEYNDEEEDVFGKSKPKPKHKITKSQWIKKKELKEIMSLITELRVYEAKEKTKTEEQDVLELLDLLECLQRIEEYEQMCYKFSEMSLCDQVVESLDSKVIDIKVKYRSEIKSFSIKENEKFYKIMVLMAESCNEGISDLIFRFNNKKINANLTPLSIGVKVYDIIDCYKSGKDIDDPNVLTLNLKDSNGCEQQFKVSKFDRVCKIMTKYSKLKGIPFIKFNLEFDGIRLDRESKISSLGIEDQSQIDVILKTN